MVLLLPRVCLQGKSMSTANGYKPNGNKNTNTLSLWVDTFFLCVKRFESLVAQIDGKVLWRIVALLWHQFCISLYIQTYNGYFPVSQNFAIGVIPSTVAWIFGDNIGNTYIPLLWFCRATSVHPSPIWELYRDLSMYLSKKNVYIVFTTDMGLALYWWHTLQLKYGYDLVLVWNPLECRSYFPHPVSTKSFLSRWRSPTKQSLMFVLALDKKLETFATRIHQFYFGRNSTLSTGKSDVLVRLERANMIAYYIFFSRGIPFTTLARKGLYLLSW